MKKSSKSIKRNYQSHKNNDASCPEFYGLIFKEGHVKVDTKRYKKFFTLPNNKIEIRNTVYYEPKMEHKFNYYCNIFRSQCEMLKEKYLQEFKKAIEVIKTPKQVEDNVRVQYLNSNDYETAAEKAIFKGIKRINTYKYVIKSLYAQFFHQMMSEIDAQTCRVLVTAGFREDDFSKKSFDVYIQSKQGENALKFEEYKYYHIYDRAYCVWNFLKHNSSKAYSALKKRYPEMIYDPNNIYKNGDLALSVLKLDEKYILKVLDELPLFFDEVCTLGFNENVIDARWDYEDYFRKEVEDYIKSIDPFDE